MARPDRRRSKWLRFVQADSVFWPSLLRSTRAAHLLRICAADLPQIMDAVDSKRRKFKTMLSRNDAKMRCKASSCRLDMVRSISTRTAAGGTPPSYEDEAGGDLNGLLERARKVRSWNGHCSVSWRNSGAGFVAERMHHEPPGRVLS